MRPPPPRRAPGNAAEGEKAGVSNRISFQHCGAADLINRVEPYREFVNDGKVHLIGLEDDMALIASRVGASTDAADALQFAQRRLLEIQNEEGEDDRKYSGMPETTRVLYEQEQARLNPDLAQRRQSTSHAYYSTRNIIAPPPSAPVPPPSMLNPYATMRPDRMQELFPRQGLAGAPPAWPQPQPQQPQRQQYGSPSPYAQQQYYSPPPEQANYRSLYPGVGPGYAYQQQPPQYQQQQQQNYPAYRAL